MGSGPQKQSGALRKDLTLRFLILVVTILLIQILKGLNTLLITNNC